MMRYGDINRHGGQIDVMAGAFPDAPKPWLDLSTGINPWPYPVPALAPDAWARLPSGQVRTDCEAAMARAFSCHPSVCRAFAGTEMVIRQLPDVLHSRHIALRSPSYADHAQAWQVAGAEVREVDQPLELVGEVDTVVLVNPNNPDGYRWTVAQLEDVRQRLARRGGWLIVDEAYADLDPAASMAPFAGRDGLIVLRSFGKFFGLAGARLGAVLAPPHILASLAERFGVWDVSGPALTLGAKAYADQPWHEATRSRVAEASTRLQEVLINAGLQDAGGTDLFRYVRAGDAQTVWRRLAQKGIAVRRFEGQNTALRIGLPPDPQALSRLAKALAASG